MTIKHNVVVVGGIQHKAVGVARGLCVSACELCSLNKTECSPCTPRERGDGYDVIFKRHYRPTHKELMEWSMKKNA
jgi:hypothetical protein